LPAAAARATRFALAKLEAQTCFSVTNNLTENVFCFGKQTENFNSLTGKETT
jgi:hypothetical protein